MANSTKQQFKVYRGIIMGFKHIQLDEKTHRILGRGCDCYLLLASHEAVMIDSGCDAENIQKYASTLTHLPINKVINTHSHFDHTGGNGFFKEIYMTKQQSLSAKNWMDEDPTKLNLNYEIKFIEEGLFEIEGRNLEIIMCDCHSPGNIAILDRLHRYLFVGDEIDRDQVLLLPGFAEEKGQLHSRPSTCVNEYKKMLQKLKMFESSFDWICTGHNGSPLEKNILDDFIQLCTEILEKHIGSDDLSSPTYSKKDTHFPFDNAHYKRASCQGCSLVYCSDDYYDTSKNNVIIPATPLHIMCEQNLHIK